jgi:hypothetical protein
MSDFNVVTVPAKEESGVKTGVTVQTDETFTVSACGRASYVANGTLTTYPDGTRYNNGQYIGGYMNPQCVVAGAAVGTLIIRIGSGPWFAAGSSMTFSAQQAGEVIVAYNDRPGKYGDNSGDYTAMIENHGRIMADH